MKGIGLKRGVLLAVFVCLAVSGGQAMAQSTCRAGMSDMKTVQQDQEISDRNVGSSEAADSAQKETHRARSHSPDGTSSAAAGSGRTGHDAWDAYCEELYGTLGMEKVDQELSGISGRYGEEGTLSFSRITRLMMEGQVEEAFREAAEGAGKKLMGEMLVNRGLMAKLFLLVVVASVFHNYSSVLKSGYAAEQGFYVTYLMIAALLIQSFSLAYEVAEHAVAYLKEMMSCMLPAFYLSIVIAGGLTTSQMVSSLFLGMLSVVERLLLGLILPGIRIYFLIILMNQIGDKDRFSKLAGLLRQGISLALKTMVTGIVGLNLMKSLLVPVYESARCGLLQKGLSILPGGASLSGLGTLLLGAGVLLKNSVGIAVVVMLLVITGVPVLKLFGFSVLYRILLALIQPVSDKRIMAGIQGAADSISILLKAVATAVVLFILSVAIVVLTTNVRLYVS